MAKIKINKLCSKERLGRLVIALLVLMAAFFLVFIGFIGRFILFFIGIYLLVTVVIGSCLVYAVFK
jgi:predicted membrane protein